MFCAGGFGMPLSHIPKNYTSGYILTKSQEKLATLCT